MLRFSVAVMLVLGTPGLAMAQSDAVAGEALFKTRCQVCHTIGEGATNKIGPALNGIVEAPIGGVLGFAYSGVLQQAGADGRVWTIAALRHYLRSPKKLFPGTKMTFAGQHDPDDLGNLIAYLASFNEDGTRASP